MKNMARRILDIVEAGKTLDLAALEQIRKIWMETYLGLFLILSKEENKPLEYMKQKLAEANEAVMKFFDVEIKKRSPHG